MSRSQEPSSLGPASTPPVEDTGADTQRRFRHQACYAAMLSLGLLEDELLELYCEHHDDVLLRLKSGLFKAVQLKTRMAGGVPFKATEVEILGSIRKFAELETTFPGQFEGYVLGSNVGFWRERKNGSNLEYLLGDLHSNGNLDLCAILIKKISAIKPVTEPLSIAAALRKLELHQTPGLDDAELRLREALLRRAEFEDRRFEHAMAAAEALVAKVLAVSALAGLNSLPEYFLLCSESPKTLVNAEIIRSKRITKATVIEIFGNVLSSGTVLLRTHHTAPIGDFPRSMSRMEIKMVVGGLTLAEIDHLKDLNYSAQVLLNEWLYKFGKERAQKYYEHLRVIVRGECLTGC
jgi:hypothetical protein